MGCGGSSQAVCESRWVREVFWDLYFVFNYLFSFALSPSYAVDSRSSPDCVGAVAPLGPYIARPNMKLCHLLLRCAGVCSSAG